MPLVTRQPRGEARRAELLDGLIDLFLAEGFMKFNLDDLAGHLQCSKSTLYGIAPSKEQLIAAVVRAFFRRATERVEARLTGERDPVVRIGTYLVAISNELSPASGTFFSDVSDFGPARELYRKNTVIAALRVQELVSAASAEDHHLDAAFIGAVAGTVMEAIQQGDIAGMTSLNDAAAYRMLADLIVTGVLAGGHDQA